MPHTNVLSIALDGLTDPLLAPLPLEAAELLHRLDAPPRLVAHLRAVHDVAVRLLNRVTQHCPALVVDRDAVLFGAATHDIGKVLYPAELSGPGSRHEEAGRELLLAQGVDAARAEFAATHASWRSPDVCVEDLLVSLADKIWKNKRVPDLEDLLVGRLAEAGGRAVWEEFMVLDEVLTDIGAEADQRLAYQMSHPLPRG
ncbi:HD domain-containing protein [Streptomyces sp. NPDC086787]|uniref:HD domain-containing protein n=1 Tax=Streptomyces sp. NPDC086787 TaxID=3365759 RepID=UPI00382D196A